MPSLKYNQTCKTSGRELTHQALRAVRRVGLQNLQARESHDSFTENFDSGKIWICLSFNENLGFLEILDISRVRLFG